MIIPIRCVSCGKVIADRWSIWTEEVNKMKNNDELNQKSLSKMSKNTKLIVEKHFNGVSYSHIFEKIDIKKDCCKRHFLGHVPIIQKM